MTPTGFRAIQRSALHSKKLRRVSHAAERLYWRLMLSTDPYGTADADPVMVCSTAAPGCTTLTPDVVAAALQELEDAGLIVRWCDGDDQWLHIIDFDKHQLADFLRKRGARHSPIPPQEPAPVCPDSALGAHPKERTKNQDKEVKPINMSALPQQQTTQDDAEPADAVRVFDHWAQVEAATGGFQRPKRTAGRMTKIKARLREGYTAETLCTVIDAYARDPFHLGQNPQRRRYTDLTTTMRNGAKVEQGMLIAADLQGTGNLTAYVRPIND